MPFYDRKCTVCQAVKIDSYEPITTPFLACEACGEPTERVWTSRASAVRGDEIPGGFVFDHVVPGLKVYSETEKRRVLKEHGYVEHNEHIPSNKGTDKNKHTSRWTAIPMDEAARLAHWHEHEAQLQAELASK